MALLISPKPRKKNHGQKVVGLYCIGQRVVHKEWGTGIIQEEWGSWTACRGCCASVSPNEPTECCEDLVLHLCGHGIYQVAFDGGFVRSVNQAWLSVEGEDVNTPSTTLLTD